MTRSSRDWSNTVVKLRKLNAETLAGGPKAFRSFKEYVSTLLCFTVGADRGAGVHLMPAPDDTSAILFGGLDKHDNTVKLADGRYLKFVVDLFLSPGSDDSYMRTKLSTYQYQEADDDSGRWIFRYDYVRDHPPGAKRYPGAHFHVLGTLQCNTCLPKKTSLKHVHFPAARPTIEGVVRLLADQFDVPSASPREVWDPALRGLEEQFLAVAHRPSTS